MQIVLTGAAARQLLKLSANVRERIMAKLNDLAAGRSADTKQLTGRAGSRLRVGDWRVIYTIESDTLTVHAVGHRRDIYD